MLSGLIVALSLAAIAASSALRESTANTLVFAPRPGSHIDPNAVNPGVVINAIEALLLAAVTIALYEILARGLLLLSRKSRRSAHT
jgi:hypothetical protein